ncbi:hypothetical protein V1525DRAFT_392447 [Lipomyces kononenkoae]|uniref:Uncharacterized protein n=1 Tax=Lipomyces kononenkoae TaxID=34357 RepID=A0ACC3TC49_LIPKO
MTRRQDTCGRFVNMLTRTTASCPPVACRAPSRLVLVQLRALCLSAFDSSSRVSERRGYTTPRSCREANSRVCSRWFHSSQVQLDVCAGGGGGPLRSKLGSFLLSSATSSVHAAAEPVSKLEPREYDLTPRRTATAELGRVRGVVEDAEKKERKNRFLTEDVGVSGSELRALLLNRRRDILSGQQEQTTEKAPKSESKPAESLQASSAGNTAPDSQIQDSKVKEEASSNTQHASNKTIKETTQDQIRTLFKSISITPSSSPAKSPPPPQSESAEQHLPHHKARARKWTRSAIEELLLERSLIHKATTAGNLVRCTVFDLEGSVTVVSGEFKKAELLSKHGLLPRDLRKLDTGSYMTMPAILVRNNSILINLLHIRALIKADMVIIFDAYGSTDSQTQSVFMYDLEGKLAQGSKAMGGLPYEMRALEAILISVVTALDAEMKIHTTIVTSILADLENNIDREKLRHLLVQSKALAQFLQKATLVRDAINEVLEQDDDLAGMYLTEKLNGIARPHDQHSEVEMLLESYYKHCDEIVQAANITMSNVRTTEEIVNIILDANRNSLMLLELKFTIGALGLGAGALVAALYGMNLKNFMEDSVVGFWTVSMFASAVVGLIIIIGLKNLRKVQRVTMMWEHGAETASHGGGGSSNTTTGGPRGGAAIIRPIVVVGKARQKSRFWR